jgi:hypothetical protein
MAGIAVYQLSFWWRFGWSIPLIHRNIICLAKSSIAALTLNRRCRRRKEYNCHICLNRRVLSVLHFGFVSEDKSAEKRFCFEIRKIEMLFF